MQCSYIYWPCDEAEVNGKTTKKKLATAEVIKIAEYAAVFSVCAVEKLFKKRLSK